MGLQEWPGTVYTRFLHDIQSPQDALAGSVQGKTSQHAAVEGSNSSPRALGARSDKVKNART